MINKEENNRLFRKVGRNFLLGWHSKANGCESEVVDGWGYDGR